MALYKCNCGKTQKEISRATIGLRDGKWVTTNAICECGLYMDSEPEEGMPTLIRTEESLTRNSRRDNYGRAQKKNY
jgi:hypothetical protein